MPKTRQDKIALKEALSEKIKRQAILIFSRAHGLPVNKQQTLRRLLRRENAEYKIAKRTILKKALDEALLPFLPEAEKGEVAVMFGYGDEVSPAKALAKFRKENPDTFQFLGGVLAGRLLSRADVVALAKLPGREELIGQLVSVLISPIRGFMNVLQGNQRKLVVALAQIATKK